MAPEVFKGRYDEKCDIWSCGIIMYSLLQDNLPFDVSTNRNKMPTLLKNFDFKRVIDYATISLEGKDFIKSLLEKDAKKRISAADALNHEWFKSSFNGYSIKIADKVLENLLSFKVKKYG